MKIIAVSKIAQDLDHPLKPYMPEVILKLEKAGKHYTASWRIAEKSRGEDVAVCAIDVESERDVEDVSECFTAAISDRKQKIKSLAAPARQKALKHIADLELEANDEADVERVCQKALDKIAPGYSLDELDSILSRKLERKALRANKK